MKSIDRQCKLSATNITGIKYGIVQESCLVYLQIENHETALQIDVTIGGVFDYVGLKDFMICPFLSLTSNICSAVFTLAINRLHSFKRQPFWFHSLNSMVPVKGIDLFY